MTYWQYDQVAGLKRIIDVALGRQMTTVFDLLSRNAFLTAPFKLYGLAGATGLAGIANTDTLTTNLIDTIHLGMAERNVPYAIAPMGIEGNIFCVTSPGALFDLRGEDDANKFIDVLKYARPTSIVNNEVGSYHNTRFIQSNDACLYNCGEIIFQYDITAEINAGDGAPTPSTPVDSVLKVGQASGVTNFIQLEAFGATDFAVGDIVTIHVDRTNAHGITNGVDWTDGKLHNRRIVSIDAGNDRLTFDRPIMEDFTTDLGSGVYGYVTKGRNIHTAIFLGGNDGVVMGVGQPPRVVTPRAVDDFEEMQRFAWKAYVGHTVFEPSVFEVCFLAGTNRLIGPAYVGPT